MYTVTVNKNEPINIEPQQINWDIIEFSERKFHILQGRRSYEAVVTEANFDDKCFTIKINNNYYEVSIKDEFDRLADRLGFADKKVKVVNNVKAPMSGVVLDIMVNDGSTVAEGDSVLILEAMKMENIIKAERDATIKNILISKGASVDKNQVLIEYE
jgi:acetyl/propionyl-CoA carboxylase alpha subunit